MRLFERSKMLSVKVSPQEEAAYRRLTFRRGNDSSLSDVMREALELLCAIAEPDPGPPERSYVSQDAIRRAKGLQPLTPTLSRAAMPILSDPVAVAELVAAEPVLDLEGSGLDPATARNPKGAGKLPSITSKVPGDAHGRSWSDLNELQIGRWASEHGKPTDWSDKMLARRRAHAEQAARERAAAKKVAAARKARPAKKGGAA